jgi:hypothetical protein
MLSFLGELLGKDILALQTSNCWVIELGGQISPQGQPEKTADFGGGAIPVSLASILVLFLKQDLTAGVKYSLLQSPREILMDTIKGKEWFKGIVLSSALFEHFASVILKELTKGGVNNKNLNLNLERLFRLLLDFGLVDKKIHSKMHEIQNERNGLVHDPFTEIDTAKAERLITSAIEVLESLKVADIK